MLIDWRSIFVPNFMNGEIYNCKNYWVTVTLIQVNQHLFLMLQSLETDFGLMLGSFIMEASFSKLGLMEKHMEKKKYLTSLWFLSYPQRRQSYVYLEKIVMFIFSFVNGRRQNKYSYSN